jgi:uncharacterized protein (DUF302 family)
MSYYIGTTLPMPFERAIDAVETALAHEGFGIVSRIDIQATLRSKIGIEFRPYTILGACNPKLAYEALQIEDKVGTMLPCNVVVQHLGAEQTEVAAIDPVASMQAIENSELASAAADVRSKLQRVIDSLTRGEG